MSEPTCPWCGTRMRGRVWPDCPRGKFCVKAKAEHDVLMARIAALAKEGR